MYKGLTPNMIVKIILNKISRVFSIKKLINKHTLKKNGATYCKDIRIAGKIVIDCDKQNRGRIKIGQKCDFNSDYPRVNPLGYNTPCVFRIRRGGEINIGNNVGMSNTVIVSYVDPVIIHDYVTIGGGCKMYTSDFHPLNPELRKEGNLDKAKTGRIEIGENAFIGAGAMILKGVKVGKNAIIGAGSVVTKDIPDNEIWGGNPAKLIRKQDDC